MRRRTWTDLAWLGFVGALVLVVLLWPYLRYGYRFGVGPDVPVYLWWARVGAERGLSLVGARPGTPALIPLLGGTLGLSPVAVVAGLESALGACIALGIGALVRSGRADGARAGWVIASLLAGIFSVHLAAGYLANLAFVVPFIGAGVALAARTPRGTIAAAVLLGGGGLAHPQFFLVGIGILLVIAAWSRVRDGGGRSTDAARAAAAAGAGAAVVVAGLVSMGIGPDRLSVDTSKDAFLRRAGLASELRHAYLDRFVHRWTRYVQWLSVPLAIVGAAFGELDGFVRRFLVAWTAFVVLGVPLGLLTGWYPADRLITFGFSIPALAAVGLAWGWTKLASRRRRAAAAATAALVGAMAAGSLIAWGRQQPFVSPLEVERASEAAAIASTLPRDTPLVFVVDDADATATFLATRAANVIRAAMPPERADDVFVYVGTAENLIAGRPTERGRLEYDELSRTYLTDIRAGAHGRTPVAFVLAPFDRSPDARVDPALTRWGRGVFATIPSRPVPPAPDPLRPSSPEGIALAAIAMLGLVWAAGFGWARWSLSDSVVAAAAAPAIGLAAMMIAGVAIDRLGLRLAPGLGPPVATILAGGTGYLLLVAQGKAQDEAPPEIDREPQE